MKIKFGSNLEKIKRLVKKN